MLKLKMMLCVMMLPLVVVGCTSAVCQSVREATTASAWMAIPRLADTAERDYFTLRERLITMQKQLEGTQGNILMSSADRVALIDGAALMQLL